MAPLYFTVRPGSRKKLLSETPTVAYRRRTPTSRVLVPTTLTDDRALVLNPTSGEVVTYAAFRRALLRAGALTGKTTRRVLPASAVVNLRDAGAVGDGVADDTQVFQTAISNNLGGGKPAIYLPKGRYLVSASLLSKNAAGTWRAGLTIFGEDRDETVIVLKDGTFTQAPTAAAPQAVIVTASNSADTYGQNNQAFNNHLGNLTISTGRNNPGAVALDWLGNNCSSLRDLVLLDEDNQAKVGLSLTRNYPGPQLGKGVIIRGFEVGVDVTEDEYSVTFEGLTLEGQRLGGVRNSENAVIIRGLRSRNTVPAVINSSTLRTGMVTLLDAELTGGVAGRSAIETNGPVYARNVTASGYDSAVRRDGVVVPGLTLGEYVSEGRVDAGDVGATFALPVEETPGFVDNDLTNWNVGPVGRTNLTNERNDAPFLQAQLDSGKATVCLIPGTYRLAGGVTVPASVRRIVAYGAQLDISTGATTWANAASPAPVVRVADGGGAEPLIIEGLTVANYNNTNVAGLVWYEHASSRTVVLKDLAQFGYGAFFYRNQPGAGKLFIENIGSLSPWLFPNPQDVWARQFNPENHDNGGYSGGTIVKKTGGSLWVLGMKTEDPTTVAEFAGGKVEINGAFFYGVRALPSTDTPMIVANGTQLKVTYLTQQNGSIADYQRHIVDNGVALTRSMLPVYNKHAVCLLYLSADVAARASGGTGLTGEYFDNGYYSTDFTGLTGTRVDPQVNFDWGYSIPPGTGITNKDTISARWTGYLVAPVAGNYSFGTIVDPQSRSRVFVSGAEVSASTPVALAAGQKVPLRVEWVHNNNNAVARLLWSLNGGPAQIVPASALYVS